MTNDDVKQHIKNSTPLIQVMFVFRGEVGLLEQDGMQRSPSTPIEVHKMMLEGVERILAKAQEVGLVTRTPN